MPRQPIRALLAATLSMTGFAWIVNSNPWSGPVLVTITPTHGVHVNDWLTFALWAAAGWVAAPGWAVMSARRLQRATTSRSA